MLKDFIAKLPISVIVGTEIEDTKVAIPTTINTGEFYSKFKSEIESDGLTPEKAIYLASINKPKSRKSISSLLIKGR